MGSQKNTAKKNKKTKNFEYSKFDKIDGSHPLKKIVPDGFVPYKVRLRHGGRVAAFNFELAREIGLLPIDHPDVMSSKLEKKILKTFGIIIINEYDVENDIKFPEKDIKPNTYMATRYLQLQHECKMGTTSGDGRSIWNGQVKNKGKVWDISSCGTGATRLSPATSKNNKFYQSGDPSISYGCGYSELDEGLESLFFSEVLHNNGVPTERVLAIVEFEKGYSITVRAHPNLLRPSHFFRYLKQGKVESLKSLADYYIDSQERNKLWKNVPKNPKSRYNFMLEQLVHKFAEISAQFEDEYIFCWLDWDGDNVLMDGGIIDYGSIRQFGLFHHEYRYDDDDRYSTSIVEQKQKAKYMVQTFAQLIDYICHGKKKPIAKFAKGKALKHFEKHFEYCKNKNLLFKIGFTRDQVDWLLKGSNRNIKNFKEVFSYFERSKSKEGIHEVADGINWNAIFCMRDILRELPQLLLSRDGEYLDFDEFLEVIRSNYATDEDLEFSSYRKRKVEEFQKSYMGLVSLVARFDEVPVEKVLLDLSIRSSVINKYDRVTGDSITSIVNKIMKQKPKLEAQPLFDLLSKFVEYQVLDPDKKQKTHHGYDKNKILKGMLKIVRDYREGL